MRKTLWEKLYRTRKKEDSVNDIASLKPCLENPVGQNQGK
ncbi:hypothetical protein GCM10007887_43290 [Methylobacterium haplocladii]|nr:hypothetical protein GCM10007887_43290 [Methylobacterium haplocladii]